MTNLATVAAAAVRGDTDRSATEPAAGAAPHASRGALAAAMRRMVGTETAPEVATTVAPVSPAAASRALPRGALAASARRLFDAGADHGGGAL